jgi:hypothetical protein
VSMTREQLHVLQHSLGLDKYGQGEMYRNHFCAGGKDVAICQSLIDLGYMQQFPTTKHLPYFNCNVTESGKEAVKRESPAPPMLTRGQKRYRQFLKADTGMKFGDWLAVAPRPPRQR